MLYIIGSSVRVDDLDVKDGVDVEGDVVFGHGYLRLDVDDLFTKVVDIFNLIDER